MDFRTLVTSQPFQASRRRRGDLRTLRSAYEEWLTAFSGSGSSYVIGKAVVTEDEDWDF